MRMGQFKRAGFGVIAATALALACTSTPPAEDEIAHAEETIALARARDAGKHAPAALRKAEEKLDQARSAARDDDDDGRRQARRFAEEATVDAQLALAQSQRAQTERDVEELSRTLDALEDEVDDGRD